jgi:hypothetical protein
MSDILLTVVDDGPELVIELDVVRLDLSSVGLQGPAGPAGAAGGSLIKTAGAPAVSGHRVVVSSGPDDVVHADTTVLAHASAVLGVTEGSASAGSPVTVRTAGEIIEGTWAWTPGLPLFCGAGGVLTQTPPNSGAWVRIVGHAESATKIMVALREPIALI